ncbi:MAG: hypothetical protein WC210_08645 [Candidatus Neomarinimicrobiota bacterium]
MHEQTSSLNDSLKASPSITGLGGSMEYKQTWKRRVTPSGLWYWEHTASAHRTSGNDYGGWPTPNHNTTGPGNQGRQGGKNLQTAVLVAGWPTTTVNDATGSQYAYSRGRHDKMILKLPGAAMTAGWPTPAATEARQGYQDRKRGMKGTQKSLTTVAIDSISGLTLSGGPAVMESIAEFLPDGWSLPENGKLNHRFSLWTMGYPVGWAYCGERAMLSFHKLRRRSSR